MVTTASSAASGRRLYAATRALARASSNVSTEIPLSRAICPSASRNSKLVLLMTCSPSHLLRLRSPCKNGAGPLDLVIGHPERAVGQVRPDQRAAGGVGTLQRAADPPDVLGSGMRAQGHGLPDGAGE